MRLTFLNGDSELRKRGEQYLNSRREDFEGFAKFGYDSEDAKGKKAKRFFEQTGDFFNYGLSFDFLDAGTFDDQPQGYYRYQLSWGGPSDELRFYHDGTIEYVFLDWGTGVGFDVTSEDWAQWVKNTFEELCSIDWDSLDLEQIEVYEYDEEE